MTGGWGTHGDGTHRDPVDGGDGGTRRDGVPAGADGGTRRDPVDGGGTRRDGPTQADGAQAPFVRVVLPPLLASRFSVAAELHASGAEADVVLADERSSGRRMVVKLYRRGVAADEEAVARLARADRRHVVEVVDRGWEEGCWFEALEYCEQGSLRSLMNGGATLAVEDVVREVAAALEHVHGLGLVHRDLKPENVLVRRASPLDLVLGDFGLVRVVDASVRWTRAWGTPAYSPPEFEGGEASP
ncbi:MAG TPA: protein kinase, partial [Acidimicrobiales bacterium]|nr:protein kinase [Acidimicrobiales bacterium]